MNYANHDKAKTLKVAFLNLLINPFFYNCFSYYFFLIYVKMCKNLSAKYYQRNTTKKLMKDISFKEEKEKKVTIWFWTLQKSIRRWKKETGWL